MTAHSSAAECMLTPKNTPTHLVVGLVAKQGMHKKVCNIFSMNGATYIHIFCQNPFACSWLGLQTTRSDDGELHVSSYALYTDNLHFHMDAITLC